MGCNVFILVCILGQKVLSRKESEIMGVIEELGDDEVGVCPVCSKNADNRCTACRKIFYCSRECQKKDWKTHKLECKGMPYKVNEY